MVLEEKDEEDIKDLYRRIKDSIKINQDSNEFYDYFYRLLDNSNNFCTFSSENLLKTIDEEWVSTIEEAVPAIQAVVQNPRKFIEEDRQVVNIAMARNILSESVQHLLQHSNLIDKVNEDGTVIPNRILNVYKEESFNTYENRFISTLILELQRFVNKRFDVIFDHSKDEVGTHFEVESNIDNYTERIDYKLSIHIKEKQSDISNDDENKNIFNRIAKIHRQVNDLAMSGFMATMRQYPLVRHPIVKTNAIGKNRYYKICHNLWNYIHSYDRVGYCVNVLKQEPVISKSFEKDIYHSIIMNYALLQSNMEYTKEIVFQKEEGKKELSLKEVRQLLSEIVNGMHMPENQVRKIIMTELTNLQSKKRADISNREKAFQKKKGKRR